MKTNWSLKRHDATNANSDMKHDATNADNKDFVAWSIIFFALVTILLFIFLLFYFCFYWTMFQTFTVAPDLIVKVDRDYLAIQIVSLLKKL